MKKSVTQSPSAPHAACFTAFKMSHLSLVFQRFVYSTVLVWTAFGLFCLEFAQVLESVGFYPLPSLGRFLAIICHLFKYFSSHAFFLLFWDSISTNVSSSLLFHWPLRLCSFCFGLFSVAQIWSFIVLVFSSLILSSIPSILLLSLSSKFLLLLLIFQF